MRPYSGPVKNPKSFVYANITIGGVPVTDRAFRVHLTTDIDSKGWLCTLELHNHYEQTPDLSAIEPGEDVAVSIVASSTKGNPGGGDLVFTGKTGDSISSLRQVEENDVVTIRCRGEKQKRLQDFFILDERVYPIAARDPDREWRVENDNIFASAVQVANEILSENGVGVTLIVQNDPNFNIYPYKVADISVWDALQNLFAPTGFDLREKYHGGSLQLVLSDPLSAGGSDTVDDYSSTNLDKSDANVRNRVRVYWRSRDPDADEAAGGIKTPGAPEGILYVEVEDAGSQGAYGVKSMKMAEDETSLIDTYGEALNYASLILSDLSAPTPSDRVEIPGAYYHIEPYDSVTLSKRQSGTLKITATEIEIVPGGIARTVLSGVRKVVREHENHIKREARTRARASNETAQAQFRVGSKERAAMRQIGKDDAGDVEPPVATGGILEVKFTFPRIEKDERGKPVESLGRYKVYYKKDYEENSPIPDIDIEDELTYDGTIFVDDEVVIVPVKRVKDEAGVYHNEIVAVKITAFDRMSRENKESLQAEGKALAYRVPVAIDAGVIIDPPNYFTDVWDLGKNVTVPEDHFWVVQVVPMEAFAVSSDPLLGELNSVWWRCFGLFTDGNGLYTTVLEPGTYNGIHLHIYHEIRIGGIEDPGWGRHQFDAYGNLSMTGTLTTKAEDYGFEWPDVVYKWHRPSVFWIIWQVPY